MKILKNWIGWNEKHELAERMNMVLAGKKYYRIEIGCGENDFADIHGPYPCKEVGVKKFEKPTELGETESNYIHIQQDDLNLELIEWRDGMSFPVFIGENFIMLRQITGVLATETVVLYMVDSG